MKPNLVQNFFHNPDMAATRAGFGDGLVYAGQFDERIVALCSDLTESTKMDQFASMFPKRFIEIGVAEQNMVTVASGMTAMGKIPFCASYAMFSPGRNWEQIRTTIAYNDRKVIIVGAHSGISVGPDGGTHQALEDIALMRIMPNMTVVVPCDSVEAKKATIALAHNDQKTPAYLRLTREKTPIMTDVEDQFEIGKAYLLYLSQIKPDQNIVEHYQTIFTAPEKKKSSKKIAIIGCGPILAEALYAARELSEVVPLIEVWNFHTIKPLDTNTLDDIANRFDLVVTVEEHQKAGGLGSAVAEYYAEHHPIPMVFIGVDNRFGQSGTMEELIKEYNLDKEYIVKKITILLD